MKVCARPGCPDLTTSTYCPPHTPAPWAGSNRKNELPPDWYQLRQIVLRRDRHCQLCGATSALEVDHINDRDDHHPNNLWVLCHPCHRRKTLAEAARNRWPDRP